MEHSAKRFTALWVLASFAGVVLSFTGCRDEKSTAPPVSSLKVNKTSTEKILTSIKTSDKQLVMVHVWATWCAPCREEFPELIRVDRLSQASEIDVILVSADPAGKTKQVRDFLTEQNSPWGSLIAEELNEKFITALSPDWSGAIPATFFFTPDGTLAKWWDGPADLQEYKTAIESFLGRSRTETTTEEKLP